MINEKYTKSYKSIWGLGIAMATTGPLALWLPELDPPWPSGAGAFVTLFCVIAIILGTIVSRIYFVDVKRISKAELQRRIRRTCLIAAGLLLLGLLSAIIYILNYSTHVIKELQIVDGQECKLRFIIGKEIQKDFSDTNEPPIKLLRANQYEPSKIWTPASLRNSRVALLLSFAITFFLLNLGLAMICVSSAETKRM